jgi:hypothetical protein
MGGLNFYNPPMGRVFKAQMGHPMGRVLKKILTQTQPMGDPTRGWVGFSGGFGAV